MAIDLLTPILNDRTRSVRFFNGRLLSGLAIAHNAVLWLVCFLLVALFEDYFMRGYLQFILTRVLDNLVEAISNFFTLQIKPSTTALTLRPRVVPQSSSTMIASWATSTRRRVR